MASTAYEKVLSEARKLTHREQISLAIEIARQYGKGEKISARELAGTVEAKGEDAQAQVDDLRRAVRK